MDTLIKQCTILATCIETLLVSFICPFRRRQVSLKKAFLAEEGERVAARLNSRLLRRYTFALGPKNEYLIAGS